MSELQSGAGQALAKERLRAQAETNVIATGINSHAQVELLKQIVQQLRALTIIGFVMTLSLLALVFR